MNKQPITDPKFFAIFDELVQRRDYAKEQGKEVIWNMATTNSYRVEATVMQELLDFIGRLDWK